MNSELDDLLNEARELESIDSAEYTAVPSTHPNRDKAKTLTVRLTDDEMARLQTAAKGRGLPVSAVVRTAIARELAPQHDDTMRALRIALEEHNLTIVRTVQ
jgi:post-segregation antitoxin (ccd killing protein)